MLPTQISENSQHPRRKEKMEAKPHPVGTGKNNRKWAPLSYPTFAIFYLSDSDCGVGVSNDRIQNFVDDKDVSMKKCSRIPDGDNNVTPIIERAANPYFPLHRDVLFAAVRELLILDGKIDPHTLEIATPSKPGTKECAEIASRSTCENSDSGDVNQLAPGSKDSDRSCQIATCAEVTDKKKSAVIADRTIGPVVEQNEQQMCKSSLNTRNNCSKLPTIEDDASHDASTNVTKHANSPHCCEATKVEDKDEKKMGLDYNQFSSPESLVEHVVCQAKNSFSNSNLTFMSIQNINSLNDARNNSTEPDDCEPIPATEFKLEPKFSGLHDNGSEESRRSRKISDVDDHESAEPVVVVPPPDSSVIHSSPPPEYSEFPSFIVSLVRSNIGLGVTPSQGPKKSLSPFPLPRPLIKSITNSTLTDRERNIFLSNLSSPMTIAELLPNDTTNSAQTNNKIMSFLRNPYQEPGFLLPRLLNASVTDEQQMRKAAHKMVVTMLNSIPKNDLLIPLRIFLGYRSSKAPNRDRMILLVSDVLFDVSHAMYIWTHREGEIKLEMKAKQSKKIIKRKASHVIIPECVVAKKKKKKGEQFSDCDLENETKRSLFDEESLKRIGGFDPASLLPLALGIRYCRQTKTPWADYARLPEGKAAMYQHTWNRKNRLSTNKQREKPGTKAGRHASVSKDEDSNSEHEPSGDQRKEKQSFRKRRIVLAENDPLIQLGKMRRWRRDRIINYREFDMKIDDEENTDLTIAREINLYDEPFQEKNRIIGSHDSISFQPKKNATFMKHSQVLSKDPTRATPWGEDKCFINTKAENKKIINIKISRDDSAKTWGLALLREGSFCLIHRLSPQSSFSNYNDNDAQIRVGDIILSVRNESSEMVRLPFAPNNMENASFGGRGKNTGVALSCDDIGGEESETNASWFRAVVELFKKSQILNLLVLRQNS